ncbi:MAG TPA: arylesterase [Lacunisphaera sp.]|nr:arylesterase [Lacunisphaera sp.]
MVVFCLGLVTGLGAAEPKTLLFFGDSLTAGYGLDPDEAFPALIQQKLDASGLAWRVVNAGLSGETTAGGLRRLDWILRQPVDIFVIELGGNDGLRGIDPETSRSNLESMIRRIRERYPAIKIVLSGMQMPTNMGPAYTSQFAAMYPALAQRTAVTLIPFLLEGVGGVPELNLPDGIHPTAEGHKIVAETVWRALKPLL